jgi:hypothetical protein
MFITGQLEFFLFCTVCTELNKFVEDMNAVQETSENSYVQTQPTTKF